ncbi:hypothetical protein [Nocardia terpenica]|uniref:hypothetical protein n=1 Tax=Nocardia terpenica TaxID=455432 RepID=UPI000AF3371B|nr:hypothetical protein [Nocardia terpenica]NQE90265.1 hypothetical protein [Nocardia terpenica]
MARSGPISGVQLDVLNWVSEGCPDGVMMGHTYKHSAKALEWRRLLTVSTKGGAWRAALTEAGRYYLDHGRYPDGHWDSKRKARAPRRPVRRQDQHETPDRRQRVHADAAVQRDVVGGVDRPFGDESETRGARSPLADSLPVEEPVAQSKRKPPRPRPVDNLIADIIDADGTLLVSRTADGPNYDSLIRSAVRLGKVPKGKLLVAGRGQDPRELAIRLLDEPKPIIVPIRRTLSHSAVIRLRDDEKSMQITPSVRVWALGVLDVLASALTAQGADVSAVPGHDHRGGYYNRRNSSPRVLQIKIKGHSFGVQLVEPTEKVPHEATTTELARAARDSAYTITKYDVVPSGRITLTIADGVSCLESSWTYSDDEGVVDLAHVVLELELRAAEAEVNRLADERDAAERQRRWETAMATAESAFADAHRAKVFREQAKRWRQLHELDEYLAAMQSHIAGIDDEHDAEEAARWLEWASNHRKELDPLHGRLGMPAIPKPSAEDLKPYLNGWSYYGPDHSSRW